MSVPYLREAVKDGDSEKLIRFLRLHLGEGNENVGRKEIDKSWIEALKILLHDQEPDRDFIEHTMQKDSFTLALLYFHLHFLFHSQFGKMDSRWQPLICTPRRQRSRRSTLGRAELNSAPVSEHASPPACHGYGEDLRIALG